MARDRRELNDWVRDSPGEGIGEAVGPANPGQRFSRYKKLSVLAAAYRLGIPVTVHVGIGYDILHEHPNFDGAAFGEASYRDFLIFTEAVTNLEGGVLLNFGSAIMGPEVYLKALVDGAECGAAGRADGLTDFHDRGFRFSADPRRYPQRASEGRSRLLLPPA